MQTESTLQRRETAIARLCHAGLDTTKLRLEVLHELRRSMPVDAAWFTLADPATLLFTGAVIDEVPESVTERFVANEFLQNDVNKFASLTQGRDRVQTLYGSTGGHPEASARYRDILQPLGMGDELRAALTIDGVCWGFMCLHRELAPAGFTADEVAFVRRLTPVLAEGLRTALLVQNGDLVEAVDGPGLILLSETLELLATNPAAVHWLGELRDWPDRGELPQAVRAVATRLLALERSVADDGRLPRVRLRTRGGSWLVLHASRLGGPGAERPIAVILEEAQAAEVSPLLLAAYALTPREMAVAEQVLRGLATEAISQQLCIAPLTVQQHLKAIFEKLGVRSRRELVAQVFAQQYVARMRAGMTPGADGGFA